VIGVAVVATALAVGLAAAAAAGAMPTLRVARRRTVRPSAVADLLRRAGSRWAPGHLVAASLAAAVAAAAIVMTATPVRSLAVVPALLAGAAPTAVLRRRAAARVRAVRQAWPDALAMLRGSVQAGRPLTHALIEVSLGGPPVLRGALTGLAARIQTVGLVAALEAVRAAVAEPVTDRVVEVLLLAHTEGGRIVPEVLGDLAAVVDAEVAAADEIDALALEGRINARIVFAIPWGVLVLLTAADGPFRDFYTAPAGAVVIAVGAVVSLAGIALVSRLSRVPADPRVLLRPGEVGR
jgi:tight adherence protein B